MQTGQLRSMSGVKYVTNIRSMGFGRVVEKVSICSREIESPRFHRESPRNFFTLLSEFTLLCRPTGLPALQILDAEPNP